MSDPCPPDDALREFVHVESSDSEPLSNHIRDCETCQTKLTTLRQASLEVTQEPSYESAHESSQGRDSLPPLPRESATKKHDLLKALIPGRYEYIRELGRGGMGVVVRIHDHMIGRELALKTLLPGRETPDALERLRREAMITGRLQHPGIPPVVELGELANGQPYFTMKLINGETLSERLGRSASGTTDRELLECFRSVAQTLAFAHHEAVIHRDLKPSNIMIGAFGEVQVMDWGTARTLEPDQDHQDSFQETVDLDLSTFDMQAEETAEDTGSLTRDGQVMGTISYMAPEQARGETSTLDQRADVFGLGAILCEILTGTPPYADGSLKTRLQKAMHGNTTSAYKALDQCGADETLVELCKSCLSMDPEQRPVNGFAVASKIDDHLHSVDQRLRRAEIEHEKQAIQALEARRRRRLTSALCLFALLTFAVGGWIYTSLQIERQRETLEENYRQASLVQELDDHLELLGVQRESRNWASAELYLSQARKVSREIGDAHSSQRLSNAHLDLELARELEFIPIRMYRSLATQSYLSVKGRDGLIAKELSEYVGARFGIEKHILDLNETDCQRLSSAPICPQIVDKLDDWATSLSMSTGSLQADIFQLANQLDEGSLSRQIRKFVLSNNQAELTRLAEETPVSSFRPYSLKLLAESLDDESQSIRLLTQSALSSPRIFFNHYRAAGISKRYTEFYRAGAIAFPDVPEYQVLLASSLIREKRFDEAVATLDLARSRFPDSGAVLEEIGDLLKVQQETDAARSAWLEAANLEPQRYSLWLKLANDSDQGERTEEADKYYRAALKYATGSTASIMSYVRFLRTHERESELSVAVDWLLTNVEQPTAYTYYRHALGLSNMREYSEALKLLKTAYDIDKENNPNILLLTGECHYRLGDFENAEHWLSRRVERKPVSVNALRLMGQMLVNLNRRSEAIAYLERACDRAPDIISLLQLCESYKLLGEKEKAIRSLASLGDLIAQLSEPEPLSFQAYDLATALGDYQTAFQFAFNQQLPSNLPPDHKRKWIHQALDCLLTGETTQQAQLQVEALARRWLAQLEEDSTLDTASLVAEAVEFEDLLTELELKLGPDAYEWKITFAAELENFMFRQVRTLNLGNR